MDSLQHCHVKVLRAYLVLFGFLLPSCGYPTREAPPPSLKDSMELKSPPDYHKHTSGEWLPVYLCRPDNPSPLAWRVDWPKEAEAVEKLQYTLKRSGGQGKLPDVTGDRDIPKPVANASRLPDLDRDLGPIMLPDSVVSSICQGGWTGKIFLKVHVVGLNEHGGRVLQLETSMFMWNDPHLADSSCWSTIQKVETSRGSSSQQDPIPLIKDWIKTCQNEGFSELALQGRIELLGRLWGLSRSSGGQRTEWRDKFFRHTSQLVDTTRTNHPLFAIRALALESQLRLDERDLAGALKQIESAQGIVDSSQLPEGEGQLLISLQKAQWANLTGDIAITWQEATKAEVLARRLGSPREVFASQVLLAPLAEVNQAQTLLKNVHELLVVGNSADSKGTPRRSDDETYRLMGLAAQALLVLPRIPALIPELSATIEGTKTRVSEQATKMTLVGGQHPNYLAKSQQRLDSRQVTLATRYLVAALYWAEANYWHSRGMALDEAMAWQNLAEVLVTLMEMEGKTTTDDILEAIRLSDDAVKGEQPVVLKLDRAMLQVRMGLVMKDLPAARTALNLHNQLLLERGFNLPTDLIHPPSSPHGATAVYRHLYLQGRVELLGGQKTRAIESLRAAAMVARSGAEYLEGIGLGRGFLAAHAEARALLLATLPMDSHKDIHQWLKDFEDTRYLGCGPLTEAEAKTLWDSDGMRKWREVTAKLEERAYQATFLPREERNSEQWISEGKRLSNELEGLWTQAMTCQQLRPNGLNLQEIQQALPPQSEVWVLARVTTGVRGVRIGKEKLQPIQVPISSSDLDIVLDELSSAELPPQLTTTSAMELLQPLTGIVPADLSPTTRVQVVLDEGLSPLMVELLPIETTFLSDRVESITYVSSLASVRSSSGAATASSKYQILLVADSLPDTDPLPGALEIRTDLQTLDPDLRVLNGDLARLENIRSVLPEITLLHLSVHGYTEVNNPLKSRLMLASGPLRGLDIQLLDLKGKVVFLSACASGPGGITSAPLVQAFLRAGARYVIASRWKLDNLQEALPVERAFYAALARGLTPDQAIRQAQREVWPPGRGGVRSESSGVAPAMFWVAASTL